MQKEERFLSVLLTKIETLKVFVQKDKAVKTKPTDKR